MIHVFSSQESFLSHRPSHYPITSIQRIITMAPDLRDIVLAPKLLFRVWYKESTGTCESRFTYQTGGKTHSCATSILTELLFAEYQFRYQAQLKECYVKPNCDKYGSAQYYDGFHTIADTYIEREKALYLKEASIPHSPLKQLYVSLRKDPGWYLREELVNDCAAGGGCCGEECGCCAKRLKNLPRKGISGHCSLACQCCARRKGRRPHGGVVARIDKQYKEALESENPFFLASIASAYFAERESQPNLGLQLFQRDSAGGPSAGVSSSGPPPYERHASGSKTSSAGASK